MRVAVVGGTGAVGRLVVSALQARGDHAVVVARSTGIDVVRGSGLDAALEGVEVVVDVANTTTAKAAEAVAFFETAGLTLGAAAARAGVGRLVLLSIVGVERVSGLGYYAGKLRSEAVAAGGTVPATVLRSTAFHEFAGQMLERARLGPVSLLPRMRIQPVAADVVAGRLVDLVHEGGPGRARDLAGPQPERLRDMARVLVKARGSHRRVYALGVPGESGKALASGALLPGPDADTEGPDFYRWLATHRD
jgi:uncharacterized protein YbjT (DUF2867 family)